MMRKTLLALAIVGLLTAGASAYSGYSSPSLIAQYNPGPGSAYYLGEVNNGNVIHGNISGGVYEWNASLDANGDGTVGDPINSATLNQSEGPGTKMGAQLGSYIFWGSSSNQGVWRMDMGWSSKTPSTGYVAADDGSEGVTDDGTYLYGNDDFERGEIHKWSVTNSASSFTLTEQWTSDSDGEGYETGLGRIRCLNYDNTGSGNIYFIDYSGTSIAKIDTTKAEGAAGFYTVVNSSAHASGYAAVRYGNEGFTIGAGSDEKVHFYTITGSGTSESWSEDFSSGLNQVAKDKYGIAVDGNGQEATNMWVSSQSTGAPGGGGYTLASYLLRGAGDVNLDKTVDINDVNVIAGNWQNTSSPTWAQGDLNGDDIVDINDINIIAANWQNTYSAAAVPEPASLLLALSGLALIRRKK